MSRPGCRLPDRRHAAPHERAQPPAHRLPRPARRLRGLGPGAGSGAGPDDYVPRALFGRYLRDVLDRATAATARVTRIHADATSVLHGPPWPAPKEPKAFGGEGVLLVGRDGPVVRADHVVLAIGVPPTGPRRFAVDPEAEASGRYIDDPWRGAGLQAVAGADRVDPRRDRPDHGRRGPQPARRSRRAGGGGRVHDRPPAGVPSGCPGSGDPSRRTARRGHGAGGRPLAARGLRGGARRLAGRRRRGALGVARHLGRPPGGGAGPAPASGRLALVPAPSPDAARGRPADRDRPPSRTTAPARRPGLTPSGPVPVR